MKQQKLFKFLPPFYHLMSGDEKQTFHLSMVARRGCGEKLLFNIKNPASDLEFEFKSTIKRR